MQYITKMKIVDATAATQLLRATPHLSRSTKEVLIHMIDSKPNYVAAPATNHDDHCDDQCDDRRCET